MFEVEKSVDWMIVDDIWTIYGSENYIQEKDESNFLTRPFRIFFTPLTFNEENSEHYG